jgi:hypothetical protein
MLVYNYNDEGIFTNTSEAQKDPIDGGFIIPSNSTTIEVIKCSNNKLSIFNGTEWLCCIDYKNVELYNEIEGVIVQNEKNTIPVGHTLKIPDRIIEERKQWQIDQDNTEYSRSRAQAYPPIADQLDMAYWDRKNGTTTLDDTIQAVKDKYPKPEQV